jgi:hypothetical protein
MDFVWRDYMFGGSVAEMKTSGLVACVIQAKRVLDEDTFRAELDILQYRIEYFLGGREHISKANNRLYVMWNGCRDFPVSPYCTLDEEETRLIKRDTYSVFPPREIASCVDPEAIPNLLVEIVHKTCILHELEFPIEIIHMIRMRMLD